MARRVNQRKSRGGVLHSVCPGCGTLINELVSPVLPVYGRIESTTHYVVFCTKAECMISAKSVLGNPRKNKFHVRRTS